MAQARVGERALRAESSVGCAPFVAFARRCRRRHSQPARDCFRDADRPASPQSVQRSVPLLNHFDTNASLGLIIELERRVSVAAEPAHNTKKFVSDSALPPCCTPTLRGCY